MTVQVAFDYVLKSHESFTYFTPNVFSPPCNELTIRHFRKIVWVSFSAPDASQKCGAFLYVPRSGGVCGDPSHNALSTSCLQNSSPQACRENRGGGRVFCKPLTDKYLQKTFPRASQLDRVAATEELFHFRFSKIVLIFASR